MKSVFNENNNSAAKRIIPAAAMLALSAVMLSTSTYAWFTMNKEVEMTGLAMSATAGEGMEISLACVDSSNNITSPTSGHPSDEESEKGWKSSVIVGHYYSDIGKLRPASSVDGKKLFDATDASNGGKTASNFKEITLGDDTMAKVTLKTTLSESDDNPTINADDDNVGYYVDIPVYLRTNKSKGDETEGSIYYKMKIQKREDDGSISTTSDTDDLYKSVRVAFIPSDSSSETKIFGVNAEYYDSGKAVSGDTTKSAVTVVTDSVADDSNFPDGAGSDSGLKIPYADNGEKYGHLDFTVRVWIEGESSYCSDATSGQSWNIDMAFSLGEFATNSNTTTNP